MRKPEINNVEVDMVPLIDIISLLLMFLIVVGDSTANSTSIRMKLPRADQAKTERGMHDEGRIVIQIKPPEEGKNGGYCAVFNGVTHSNDNADTSLKEHLQKYVDDELQHGRARLVAPYGTLDIPVKLRIPEDCPMPVAEKVLFTLAQVKFTDIQYAASETKH